ncbi:hypothetical protein GCM10009536_36390 [Streptomyces thermocarboxydus]
MLRAFVRPVMPRILTGPPAAPHCAPPDEDAGPTLPGAGKDDRERPQPFAVRSRSEVTPTGEVALRSAGVGTRRGVT